jgi:hypothetical protein
MIEVFECLQLFDAAELGFLNSRFHDADCLVIGLDRHWIGMAILATMRK